MPKINAIDLKPGNVLEHQNKLWIVLKRELVQPGKGGSFAQVELRDLRGGNKLNERFRTQETVERVRLDEKDMQFLYMEGDQATFMDNDNFEQVSVPRELIGDPADFLRDGMVCQIMLHEGTPLSVEMPPSVTMQIVEADRDREMRDAVQEIGRAVERIDDPAMMRVAALGGAAFLEQQAIAGAGPRQFVLQRALGSEVGGRDEFARPLDRDLQLLDLAEIADQAARRFQSGVRHHIDHRRAYRHGGSAPDSCVAPAAQSLARSTKLPSAVLTTMRVPASI